MGTVLGLEPLQDHRPEPAAAGVTHLADGDVGGQMLHAVDSPCSANGDGLDGAKVVGRVTPTERRRVERRGDGLTLSLTLGSGRRDHLGRWIVNVLVSSSAMLS